MSSFSSFAYGVFGVLALLATSAIAAPPVEKVRHQGIEWKGTISRPSPTEDELGVAAENLMKQILSRSSFSDLALDVKDAKRVDNKDCRKRFDYRLSDKDRHLFRSILFLKYTVEEFEHPRSGEVSYLLKATLDVDYSPASRLLNFKDSLILIVE